MIHNNEYKQRLVRPLQFQNFYRFLELDFFWEIEIRDQAVSLQYFKLEVVSKSARGKVP